MLLRAILTITVAGGCALAGRAMAGGHARRAKLLNQLLDALQLLRVRMLEGLLPVGAALAASDCAPLRRVGEEMAAGGSAADAWARARDAQRRRNGALDCLTDADTSALDALFSGLGLSGRAEQEALLGAAMREIGQLAHGAQKKSGESARLYATLGLLTGLALAVGMM